MGGLSDSGQAGGGLVNPRLIRFLASKPRCKLENVFCQSAGMQAASQQTRGQQAQVKAGDQRAGCYWPRRLEQWSSRLLCNSRQQLCEPRAGRNLPECQCQSCLLVLSTRGVVAVVQKALNGANDPTKFVCGVCAQLDHSVMTGMS